MTQAPGHGARSGRRGEAPHPDRPTDEQIARWYPRLYRTALRLTGSFADAADVTQQAFYKALRAWHRFDGGVLRTTWLHSILVNCARDWARRRKVRAAEPLQEWHLTVVEVPAEVRAARREELAAIRQAIEDLPEDLRRAFVPTVIDGYTYQEAADLLGVPPGTVASRVHAARRQVQAAMRGMRGDLGP